MNSPVQSSNSGKWAIVLSSTVIFVYGTVASLLGTLLPSLSSRFHLSPEQNGQIAAVQALGVALSTLVAGPFMDGKGVKSTLLDGLALMFISLIGLLVARGWNILIVAIFILGVGSGTVIVAANSLAGQVDEKQRASAVNLANTFFGLGGLATPFIAANLLSGNPIRLAYLVAALTAGALLMTVSARMPVRTREAFRISQLGIIEPKGLLILLCLVSFFYVGCEIAFWNWLPKYLISRGNDARTALNILGFGFACGMIAGRLLALPLLRRISPAAVCILAATAMAATTFAAVHISNSTFAFVTVFLSGVAMGPVFPSALGITSDSFPRMTGTCIGIVITAGWCGAAISSWIIGAIAGHDPSRLGLALSVVPLFSILIVGLSAVVRQRTPRTRSVVAESVAT